MKVTYEFDTNSENYDRAEHEEFIQASKMASALYKIKDIMRSWLKYDTAPVVDEWSHFWDELTEEEKERYKDYKQYDLDKMTDQIYDAIREAGVDMERMGY